MSADTPQTAAQRCQAITTLGRRCAREASVHVDGWHSCAEPLHIQQGTEPDHVAAATEHLADAMRHEAWRDVSGPIRHMIEWASVDLQRAQGLL